MKIYVAHTKSSDFKKELYEPLQEAFGDSHELVFPHETDEGTYPSKELLKDSCDLVIAEVSDKSTSLGIELGWANAYEIPIICMHKIDSKPSKSLKEVSDMFIEYSNSEDLVAKLVEELKKL